MMRMCPLGKVNPVWLAMIYCLLAAACWYSSPSFIETPTVSANPNPQVPLAAVLRFTADRSVTTTVQITDGVHNTELNFDDSWNPSQGLPIVGMRPDRRHEIRVAIQDGSGVERLYDQVLEFKTPRLPSNREEFPTLEVVVSKPESMEPGVTLFNPRRRKINAPQFNEQFGMLLAVDPAGEVLWYYRVDSRISDFEKLRNGNLIVVTQDFRLIELDWLGNTVNQWYANNRPAGPSSGIPVEAQTFHHEVDEPPEVVWEMVLKDEAPMGWTLFGAERLPRVGP